MRRTGIRTHANLAGRKCKIDIETDNYTITANELFTQAYCISIVQKRREYVDDHVCFMDFISIIQKVEQTSATYVQFMHFISIKRLYSMVGFNETDLRTLTDLSVHISNHSFGCME